MLAAWAMVAPGYESIWILGLGMYGSHLRLESPIMIIGCVGLRVQAFLLEGWWWTVRWAHDRLVGVCVSGAGAFVGDGVSSNLMGVKGVRTGFSISCLSESLEGCLCAEGRSSKVFGVSPHVSLQSFSCSGEWEGRRRVGLLVAATGATKL